MQLTLFLARGQHALQFSLEATRVDKVRGELFVYQLLLGGGFRGLGEFEAQDSQFLLMLRAGRSKLATDFVVRLLRFAKRGRQGIDLAVGFFDCPGKFAGLRITRLYLSFETDASRAQAFDIELQAIDGFRLHAQVSFEILYDGVAVADRRNVWIELHGLEVDLGSQLVVVNRIRLTQDRQFQVCGPIFVVRD